jgi:hypothetical protein
MKCLRISVCLVGIAAILLAGCKQQNPGTIHLAISGTNSAKVAGHYIVDGSHFDLPQVTDTNVTVAGKKVQFSFTNTEKAGEIVVNAFVNGHLSSSGASATTVSGTAP